MFGIHDWKFPRTETKWIIANFENKKLTVLCGPDDCSSRMRIKISRELAFWRTSSNVAFMDKCLTAFNIWTRQSGSRSSQARNSPTHCKSEGMNIENREKLTSDNFPRTQSIANMNIWLRNLWENQQNLNNLRFRFHSRHSSDCHHIQKSCREGIQKTFTDEHSTEVILGRRTLKFKDTADAIQSVLYKFGLLAVVFIEKVNQDLQTATPVVKELPTRPNWELCDYARDEHLKCKNGSMA